MLLIERLPGWECWSCLAVGRGWVWFRKGCDRWYCQRDGRARRM